MRPSTRARFLALAYTVTNLALTGSAFAWPPTYGSEFNFGSPELQQQWSDRGRQANYQGSQWQVPAESEKNAAKKFGEKVKEHCGEDCTVTPHSGKFGATEYKVEFRDGYTFNISVDPACVEIQTEPETLAHIETYESRAQQYIFSVADELGMDGARQTAHFNVGILSAFEGEPKAFLKYFINYHNLPELATGVLGQDAANAPPVSHLKPEQRAALSKIVEDVNAGKISTPQQVAVRIQKEVYTSTPTFDAGFHYQGISVKYVRESTRLPQDRPFEFRAPRQPKTAHERTLLAELSEKRMAFERANDGPIAFLDVPKQTSYSVAEQANSFRFYLSEMGADWDHFKELLPPELQTQPPDAFLSGAVDWSSAADVQSVKTYARYISNSAWVRTRMKALLKSPEAIASGKVEEVLEASGSSLGVQANREAQVVLNEFIASVKSDDAAGAPAVVAAVPVEPDLATVPKKGKFRAVCDRFLSRFGL